MSADASVERRAEPESRNGDGNNGVVPSSIHTLQLNPNADHEPDSYEDLQLEFSPLLFSSLEKYLPPFMLNARRDAKVQFMRNILLRYSDETERNRVQKQREYRRKIMSRYRPLHRELYALNAEKFFVPSFLQAIKKNTEEGLRSIITESSPGVYTFDMLQPHFCEMLMSEVENFEKWVYDTEFRIMLPNTMNKYGVVLDDFGLETMLEKLMDGFIRPLSRVFFPHFGGATLDSHHGFVVEYGMDRDLYLGLHVDDSEVTLNVCLGQQFSGGELFFRGIRCDKHVNTEAQAEEILDYYHVPGKAVLHCGRHRHGARATTSGRRMNLLLWCRSAVYRELKKYQKDFSSWCAVCQHEKKERHRLAVASTKLEILKRDGNPAP